MWSPNPTAVILLFSSIAGSAASSLAVFEDAACKTSTSTIIGEDGYPDGVCTDIREVADAPYKGFMFINLDDGCTPTIYQNDTTTDTCSGAPYAAYISRCYNTSWAYYSIDQCTPIASVSSSSISPTSVSTSDTTSADNAILGGAIAGSIVGSVCGLGMIAAVCVYLFWFRPKQKEREKKEKHDAGNRTAAEAESKSREGESEAGIRLHESRQQPPGLQSPEGVTELLIEGIHEVPGDGSGVEVDNDALCTILAVHDAQLAAELPGDQLYYWSSDSSARSDEAQIYQR